MIELIVGFEIASSNVVEGKTIDNVYYRVASIEQFLHALLTSVQRAHWSQNEVRFL